MSLLRRLIFVFFSLSLVLSFNKINAQSDARTHFIYIQSDSQQPFYVILNKKSYSSSSVGYLIISKLIDGNYNITVGFPKDEFPAQTYALQIKGNDAGFNLKKSSTGKTWDLIDKISQEQLAVVNLEASSSDIAKVPSEQKVSGFGDMLSKTSHDTTNYDAFRKPKVIPSDTIVKNEILVKTEDVNMVPKENTDSSIKINVPSKSGKTRTETVANIEPVKDAAKKVADNNDVNESYESAAARSATESIVKISERNDRRGISMSFVVSSGAKIDTIVTFFPGDVRNDNLDTDDDEKTASANNSTSVSPEKAALKKEVDNRKSTENPFYKGASKSDTTRDLSLFNDDTNTKTSSDIKTANTQQSEIIDNSTGKTSTSKEIFNSTCTNMLSDKDVEKIRKKMISKSTDDEMIAVARKMVDTKCVYTTQVKNIGGLLISDKGRLALYRILYPNVYDGSQFSSLEDQLLDKNYKQQFESLIHNR